MASRWGEGAGRVETVGGFLTLTGVNLAPTIGRRIEVRGGKCASQKELNDEQVCQ